MKMKRKVHTSLLVRLASLIGLNRSFARKSLGNRSTSELLAPPEFTLIESRTPFGTPK